VQIPAQHVQATWKAFTSAANWQVLDGVGRAKLKDPAHGILAVPGFYQAHIRVLSGISGMAGYKKQQVPAGSHDAHPE